MSVWTPEQNEARSAALRGRRLPPEHRAAMHASHVTGVEAGDPRWEEAYQARLRALRVLDEIIDRAALGRLPADPPEVADGASQLGLIIRDATMTYIDGERLAEELERRPFNPETVRALAEWMDLPAGG
jgi:hypothetical protein